MIHHVLNREQCQALILVFLNYLFATRRVDKTVIELATNMLCYAAVIQFKIN